LGCLNVILLSLEPFFYGFQQILQASQGNTHTLNAYFRMPLIQIDEEQSVRELQWISN
jgi:hypothetical protein